MRLFGITGGIGMGKSTAAMLLKQQGVAVTDTDTISKELTAPGAPALAEIAQSFGSAIVLPGGSLDRKALAKFVFGDDAARASLESILHPKIRARWQGEVAQWRAEGVGEAAVVIPLLYETGAEKEFDFVACVACGAASQFERLRQRGWSYGDIRGRIDAQMPAHEKVARADFVVWTDTTTAAHAAQWEILRKWAAEC